MKKKRTPIDQSRLPHNSILTRRNVPEQDLWLYARSFHTAAQTLASAFQADANLFADSAASPVVFMYRHALELHLKAIVLGEGGNFLTTKPDRISVSKSHSLSWLAQFVSQIITAVKWEAEFHCDGVETLSDFKGVVEGLNAVDPGSYVFRLPVSAVGQEDGLGGGGSTIGDFARRMDALLELLDSTGDALAAEWDLRSEGVEIDADWNGGGFGPTIQ